MDAAGDFEGTLLLFLSILGLIIMGVSCLTKMGDSGFWLPVFCAGGGICVVCTICYLV